MSTNSITVVGNLVDDLTLRTTTSDNRPVINGRVAVTERLNVNGQWQDRTNFINIVMFGQAAKNLADSVRKGDRIMVQGRLQMRDYTDANGVRQFRTEIVAAEAAVSVRWATVGQLTKVTSGAQVPADEDVPEEPF